ncbi:uncharacterized protein LOC143854515 isoform X2 [Tasmannia lanceolata]|uniref:uncharacterized protein LOC143854515 isoform X2 n=1 Tax=Tasmannia lanceolata TaxID=3420 RepID=UPI00406286DE
MAPRLFRCFCRAKKSSPENTTAEEQRRGGAVLVELFSSQGCAMSPGAELLLSRLGRGDFELDVPVIVLAYHVDYWDYLGWKDPFGSTIWTVRQKAFVEALRLDTLYTPQVVVQGSSQCLGTHEELLLSTVRSANRFAALTFQASFQRSSPDSLQVCLSGALRRKVESHGADVMVALYENGLVTDCTAGENRGRVLSNDFVVRKLEKLCTVKDISAKKTVTGSVNFSLWQGFNSSKCGVVVFVQNRSLHSFGSQQFQLPHNL